MKKFSLQIRMLAPILAITMIVMGIMTIVTARNAWRDAQEYANERTVATEKLAGQEIRGQLDQALDVARVLGQFLKIHKVKNRVNREEENDVLVQLLKDNKTLIGTWTGWEPNAWDGKDEQYKTSTDSDKTGAFSLCELG